jgi:SAM-dependent methyltransferase
MFNIAINRIDWALKYFPEISKNKVLDVGCGDAVHLYKMGVGSVGIDARVLESEDGYHFLQWNFEDDIYNLLKNNKLNKFDYIWTNSVIEHVLSPHLFLLNIRRSLNDNGILFVGAPLVNFLGESKPLSNNKFSYLFQGFLSQDHVNFFTYKTLKHTIEFSGFEVIGRYSPFVSRKWSIITGFEPFIMFACKKKKDFNYGEKAYKNLIEGKLVWKDLNHTSVVDIPK